MDNIYNDDDLGILYLMSKKIKYLSLLYKTEFEECYQIDTNIYLFKNIDKNISNFKILNLNLRKFCNEPIVEIKVNPSEASIFFISHYLNNSNNLIKVKYDNLEKNWDVRSYINNEEKLTNLNNALNILLNLDNFGTEIKEKFSQIIDSSKTIFNKSMENKLIK